MEFFNLLGKISPKQNDQLRDGKTMYELINYVKECLKKVGILVILDARNTGDNLAPGCSAIKKSCLFLCLITKGQNVPTLRESVNHIVSETDVWESNVCMMVNLVSKIYSEFKDQKRIVICSNRAITDCFYGYYSSILVTTNSPSEIVTALTTGYNKRISKFSFSINPMTSDRGSVVRQEHARETFVQELDCGCKMGLVLDSDKTVCLVRCTARNKVCQEEYTPKEIRVRRGKIDEKRVSETAIDHIEILNALLVSINAIPFIVDFSEFRSSSSYDL